MPDIEEVKKILEKPLYVWGDREQYLARLLHPEALAQQICQLFPKTEDNPDGYEPKPDESKLPTPSELRGMCPDFTSEEAKEAYQAGIRDGMEEAVDEMGAECQARIEEIFREIESRKTGWFLNPDKTFDITNNWLDCCFPARRVASSQG
mgnify:CR=1 FL=1